MTEKQLRIAKRLAWILVGLNAFDLVLSLRRLINLRDEQPVLDKSED